MIIGKKDDRFLEETCQMKITPSKEKTMFPLDVIYCRGKFVVGWDIHIAKFYQKERKINFIRCYSHPRIKIIITFLNENNKPLALK